jgi:hypothetical protein
VRVERRRPPPARALLRERAHELNGVGAGRCPEEAAIVKHEDREGRATVGRGFDQARARRGLWRWQVRTGGVRLLLLLRCCLQLRRRLL